MTAPYRTEYSVSSDGRVNPGFVTTQIEVAENLAHAVRISAARDVHVVTRTVTASDWVRVVKGAPEVTA